MRNMQWGEVGVGEVGPWELRVGEGKREETETHPRLKCGDRRDAGVLSLDLKAPAAFRTHWVPRALWPHLLRAKAPNNREHGVRSNELTRVPGTLSAFRMQLLQSKDIISCKRFLHLTAPFQLKEPTSLPRH